MRVVMENKVDRHGREGVRLHATYSQIYANVVITRYQLYDAGRGRRICLASKEGWRKSSFVGGIPKKLNFRTPS